MKNRLLTALMLAALTAACARDGFVLYRDPGKLFSAEVPGAWRVLDEDGARRVSFLGAPSDGAAGPMLSVMFYPASTPEGRDPEAFAVEHRLGARPLGPVEPATVAGAPALRYEVELDVRGGKKLESAAVVKTEKGLFVILYDDRAGAAEEGKRAYERLLSSLRF